jgi:hypothetical protein
MRSLYLMYNIDKDCMYFVETWSKASITRYCPADNFHSAFQNYIGRRVNSYEKLPETYSTYKGYKISKENNIKKVKEEIVKYQLARKLMR